MDWGLDIFPKGTDNLYRKLNGKLMIELELHTAMQLFNSFDPAPFHEKDYYNLLLLYGLTTLYRV